MALSSAAVWPLLENLADESIGGGRVHDAAIMLAAREAGADAILTFNTKHFEIFGSGMRVMAPE